MGKQNRHRLRWVRWLHLACGLSLEHVGIVLELDPSEVASLIAAPAKFRTATEAEHWHRLWAQGLTTKQIARTVGVPYTTVRKVLTRGAAHVKAPPSPPRKRPASKVGGEVGRYVRTLRAPRLRDKRNRRGASTRPRSRRRLSASARARPQDGADPAAQSMRGRTTSRQPGGRRET